MSLAYPYQVKDGLLSIQIASHKDEISEQLRRLIVSLARNLAEGKATPRSMEQVFRCSRMCWELLASGQLTDLDSQDAQILYSLPLNAHAGTEILINTLNLACVLDLVVSSFDPKTVHSASMSVVRSMMS